MEATDEDEGWRGEALRHRCMPSFGRTVWAWLEEKARLTRDDPGKVVRKIVEREYLAENGE